tara:strand:- start:150 stop:1733 length:1584 start_codon:yes stop_codon:yes gene_type:complete
MKKPKRKLAAIVFTDIVGFTKLSASDQTKASEILKLQRETLKPLVEKYNGEWIKEMGDGLLLIFGTVMEAVECCIEIQKASNSIEHFDLRIGIHQGEILIDGEDVIGDDVNVASRIEPFAATGGIAISDKVNTSLDREAVFDTKYIGKPSLKGVSQEVKVYCITSHGLPETNLSKVSAKLEPWANKGFKWNMFSLTGAILTIIGALFWINISFFSIGIASESNIPSIAILVPDNLGDQVDNKWMNFLTENIIIDIANLGNVIVTPLRNVMRLANENMNSDEIAKKLKSDYLLLSSVYVDGEKFDMNSQLIKTDNKKSVFGKKFNESIKNIPIVSKQIASDILINIGSKPDREIAYKGKQERFNEAYGKGEFKKAHEIIKPADRIGRLTVNIKGDFSYNRRLGTLNDQFFELFNNDLLPKIKSSKFDLAIDIHSSNEQLPEGSIFKNNLDMTVSVAKNLEIYIDNLNLKRNVYVYGLGDMLPRGIDTIKRARSWSIEELTPEFIKELNVTEKQRKSNNRITMTFLAPQ